MTGRMSFLDPGSPELVDKVASMIDELRLLEGERVADAEMALADMVTRDASEHDRRLRAELVRTVATRRTPQIPAAVDPEDLRRALFEAAWEAGGAVVGDDLFSPDRDTICNAVAGGFGIDPADLPAAMFADTPGERRLEFPAGERSEVAREALRTLNLERLRMGLRRAVRAKLRMPARTAGDASYVRLLWGAKRLGLMFDAVEEGGSIILEVSGPYVLFERTTMYGNRLFEFTRRVLEHAGREWSLNVDLLVPGAGRREALRTCPFDASLRSWFVTGDQTQVETARSGDEEAFQKYVARLSPAWHLDYEGALLPLGAEGRRLLMVPDFVARSPATREEVLVEIVGFWKREYLEKKIEKIRLLGNRRVMLVVNSRLSVSREDLPGAGNDLVRVFFYEGREELKHVAGMIVEELHAIAR